MEINQDKLDLLFNAQKYKKQGLLCQTKTAL